MRSRLPPPDPATAPDDPLDLFREWFEVARSAGLDEPEAAALATATASGRPSVRMVLVRGFDGHGFSFYTHYGSRKGRELDVNPWAAIAFYWHPLGRQVRIEGGVERAPAAASDAYFASRPVASRLSAVASPQSEPVENRAWLDARVAELARRHRRQAVPRPTTWGGYVLAPAVFEFWQRGEHRLHDRLRYRRGDGGWDRERLAP